MREEKEKTTQEISQEKDIEEKKVSKMEKETHAYSLYQKRWKKTMVESLKGGKPWQEKRGIY